MKRTHPRALAMPKCSATMLGCVALLGMLAGESFAQAAGDAEPSGTTRPTTWIEPSVSVGATLSSNGNASSANSRSELALDVSPALKVVMNTPRVKGFVDYSLSATYYLQGNSRNRIGNRLNADGTVDVWDGKAFVDVSGSISDEAISAFGPQTLTGLSDTNRSETSVYRISPHIGGTIAGVMDYQLRYALQTVNTSTSLRSDSTSQVLSMRVGSRPVGQFLGWSVDAMSQVNDYSIGRDTQSDIARANLFILASPQLTFSLTAGVERNDIITLQPASYNITGAGMEWRPSLQTSVSVAVENRYFGTGYNVALEHRTGRTVWRYVASRSASDSPTQSGAFSRGTIYDLLDALLEPLQPDPVRRAQLVQLELLRLGLPADTPVLQDFLRSSASLNQTQQLSVALSGIRSVVTFTLTRSTSSRLDSFFTGGDDFDINDDIAQQSWGVNYAHRITPLTSFNAAFLNQKSTGNSGASGRRQTVSAGLSTRLAPRTSGIVQVQYGRFNNSGGPYTDAAISARINHRF